MANRCLPSTLPVTGRLRIAFRADDAGLCRGVDEGILDVVAAGLVRNVSLMVPSPNFRWMAQRLAEFSHLTLGLHVTLNCEWEGQQWPPTLPARDVPSLVTANGTLLRTPQDLYDRKAALADLLNEAKSQLAVARAHGLNINYLDEHMGVGWLPGLKKELRLLAETEGLVYADDLPRIIELEQTLPDSVRFLATLSSLKKAAGLIIIHPASSHPSANALSLPGHPDEIFRRIAERNLLANHPFVREVKIAGLEPITITELAAASPQN